MTVMYEHTGWIFSKGNPPKDHVGGLFSDAAKNYKEPWAYLKDMDHWYEFIRWSSHNWEIRWPKDVPKEYLAQLLLIK